MGKDFTICFRRKSTRVIQETFIEQLVTTNPTLNASDPQITRTYAAGKELAIENENIHK